MTTVQEVIIEAFRQIITHRVPVCDDLLLELESGVKVRVSAVLQEIEEASETMDASLADQLGLPCGMSFKVGVQVYRTSIAPRPHLKRQPPITRVPESSEYTTNGAAKKARAGRRFDPDQIRSIRRLAAGGVTRQHLAGRYGVDPSFISEIVRRVAYSDVV